MKNIEVSVLLPVWNEKLEFFKKAVESILCQTFSNFELIIIIDELEDHYTPFINRYNDPRIRIIKNGQNIGITKSLNIGLKEASGKYIARLDSDDYCDQNRLLSQYDFMEKKTEYVLCGCKNVEIRGKNIRPSHRRFLEDDTEIRANIALLFPFSHSSFFFRKSAAIEIGGYNSDYQFAQDYDFICRMLMVGKVKNLNEVLVFQRIKKLTPFIRAKYRRQLLNSLNIKAMAYRNHGGDRLGYYYSQLRVIIALVLPNRVKNIIRYMAGRETL